MRTTICRWKQCEHNAICTFAIALASGILLVSARRAIDERTGDIFEAIKNMSGKEAAGTLRWPEGGNFRSCYLKERKAYQRRRKGSSAEIPPENSGGSGESLDSTPDRHVVNSVMSNNRLNGGSSTFDEHRGSGNHLK